MSGLSIGELSRNTLMTQQNREIKNRIEVLSEQMVTGQVINITRHLNGNFHELADIEHRLKTLEHYKKSMQQGANMLSVTQLALKNIHDRTQTLHDKLRQTDQLSKTAFQTALKTESRAAFDAAISSLNTETSGRSLFAGAAHEKPALATAKDIYSKLKTAINGMTKANDIVTAVETWFNGSGGGFETSGYLGTKIKSGPIQFAKGQDADWPVKADDAKLRPTLQFLALAALALDTDITIPQAERLALVEKSTDGLDQNKNDLIDLQANIGSLKARITRMQTNQSFEKSSLELAKTTLIGVDQYEITTRFEAANNQLKLLYSMTARLSKLSLVDYLR